MRHFVSSSYVRVDRLDLHLELFIIKYKTYEDTVSYFFDCFLVFLLILKDVLINQERNG